MKKALFLALSLAFLLIACGETTLPDTSEQNPVDNTQETSLPESCLLYYDLGNVSILAEDKSLPLAQNAGDGYATSYSVWYDGEYQDLALQDGDSGISVADMTGGSAVFDYGAWLVVWNGERYHCAHLTAQDRYIPNISPNIPGGILLLGVSGDCWADGGTADVACFTGFGTVVICGSGTLRIAGAGIGVGGDNLPYLPGLILDDVSFSSGAIFLNERSYSGAPALFVRSGSLETDTLVLSGDLCIAGGSGTVQYLDGVENAVFRDGSFEVNQWGDTVIPQLILSGGDATCTDWLPQGTSIEVGAGTMTANGIRYWDTVHVYGGGKIVDLMDET